MNLSADPENIFLLEQLAEQTNYAFFLFDVEKQILKYVNPAFQEIWECSRADLVSGFSGILPTVLPADRAHVLRNWFWYKSPERSNSRSFEFRLSFPDGRLKWIYAELFLVRNEDNSLVISGWVREVTGRKNNLEVLRKYAARKNAILEVLTHDLAGFLKMITNLSNSIQIHESPDLVSVLGKLALIRESSLRGAELITDLVNNEFIETASVTLNRQRLDLVQKIGDVVNMYRTAEDILKNRIEIEASEPAIYAQVDDVKFMQVINNLLSNALKFTPDGGSIKISLEEKPEYILLAISDTGIGIPEAFHSVLFERYTPARRPGLQGEPSIGLGMSIIKGIVEQHGGRIWFTSREGHGTTFYIELPKA